MHIIFPPVSPSTAHFLNYDHPHHHTRVVYLDNRPIKPTNNRNIFNPTDFKDTPANPFENPIPPIFPDFHYWNYSNGKVRGFKKISPFHHHNPT